MHTDSDRSLADTAEIPPIDTTTRASAGVGRVCVDFAGATHQGKVRPNNEDHYFVARFGRYLEPLLANMPGSLQTTFEEEGHGMVVADGMGGAAAGELASRLAIRTLLDLVVKTPDWIISPAAPEAERVMERMAERFRRVDEVIAEKAAANARLKGMGTTMTLACNVGDCLILTHIGDSRAYLYRAGALHQLTHDHTLAQALVDQGFIARTQDAATRLQHTLIRVLGGIGHQCEADVQRFTLLDGDVVILCTDGLSDMVEDAAIATVLEENPPASKACAALVDAALANGGRDNVTVIVARYGFISQPET